MDVYNQVVLGSSYHLYKSNIGLRPQTTTRMSGNSRSDVVLVLYKHHLEVPIQKKIIPMLSCPIELFFIICRSHGGSGSVISLVIIAVIIYLAYILYTKCIAPRFKRTTTNIPPPPYTHNTGGWGSGGGGDGRSGDGDLQCGKVGVARFGIAELQLVGVAEAGEPLAALWLIGQEHCRCRSPFGAGYENHS